MTPPPRHPIPPLLALIASLVVLTGCTTLNTPLLALRLVPEEHLTIGTQEGHTLFRYYMKPPAEANLAIPSGGFFHPLTTPTGQTVTDLAPEDHRHHRGLFLAFVKMHGALDADFWGWGGHAPTNARQIVNQSVTNIVFGNGMARFQAHNRWIAEGTTLIDEQLNVSFKSHDQLHILDLVYILTPRSDITVSRWAFGGFCLRLRKDGAIHFASPEGKPDHPDPNYMKPDTDWPDQPWYAASITLKTGARVGGAVINHPDNPETLWHNHPATYMINPCITAPRQLKWAQDQPITLKYRVVTFDGPIPTDHLNALAGDR